MSERNRTGFEDLQLSEAGNPSTLFGHPQLRHVQTRSSGPSHQYAYSSGFIADHGGSPHERHQPPSYKMESERLKHMCAKQSERINELKQQVSQLENATVGQKRRIGEMKNNIATLQQDLEEERMEVVACRAQMNRLMRDNERKKEVDHIRSNATEATSSHAIIPQSVHQAANSSLVFKDILHGQDETMQTNQPAVKPRHFKCQVAGCIYDFHFLCDLKNHMERHHKIPNYLEGTKGCPKCGQICPDQDDLVVHRRTCPKKALRTGAPRGDHCTTLAQDFTNKVDADVSVDD